MPSGTIQAATGVRIEKRAIDVLTPVLTGNIHYWDKLSRHRTVSKRLPGGHAWPGPCSTRSNDSWRIKVMLPEDRRRYPRLKSGVRVLYQGLPASRIEQEYLSGLSGDLSLGGMFLSTDTPFPPGTLLVLAFRTPEMSPEETPVCARALVKWRRRLGSQKGMGISFVEFEGVDRQRLKDWLDNVLSNEPGPGIGLPLPITFSFLRHPVFEQSIQSSD